MASARCAGFAADAVDDPHRFILSDRVELIVPVSALVRIEHGGVPPLKVAPKGLVALATIVLDTPKDTRGLCPSAVIVDDGVVHDLISHDAAPVNSLR